jgi:hypothetical protein
MKAVTLHFHLLTQQKECLYEPPSMCIEAKMYLQIGENNHVL